jgi:hypothetical protein
MQVDRHAQRFGSLQDRPVELVVEIASAIVAVDRRALEALTDAALQLFDRVLGRSGRHGGEAGETGRMLFHRIGEVVIGVAGHGDGVRRLHLFDAGCRQGQDLHVDAGSIHFGDALGVDVAQPVEHL